MISSLSGLLHLLGERPERGGRRVVHVGDAAHVEEDGGHAAAARRRRSGRLPLRIRRRGRRRRLAEPRPVSGTSIITAMCFIARCDGYPYYAVPCHPSVCLSTPNETILA